MSVEAELSRILDIRFAEAKSLVIEAKVKLGIKGYHKDSMEEAVLAEALDVFHNQLSVEQREKMRKMKRKLNAFKEADEIRLRGGRQRRSSASTEVSDESSNSHLSSQCSSSTTPTFRLWSGRSS